VAAGLNASETDKTIESGLKAGLAKPHEGLADRGTGKRKPHGDGADAGGHTQSKGHATPDDEDESLIAELAALSPLKYARQRKQAAEKIGIKLDMLDRLVKELRKSEDTVSAEPPHWDVEPWPEQVNGDALLRDLANVFRAHAVLPAYAEVALALWCMHTWCLDCASRSPFMTLVSAVKRSGKTTIMSLLKWLTCRSELVSNISSAALFRYIEAQQPTLLMDEGDSFLPDDEAMRGILNSGHTRSGAYVIRCEGEQLTARRFSVWAAKAIATIAKVADTVEDRSVVIDMVRKLTTEKVTRWDLDDKPDLAALRRQQARWAEDNAEALKAAETEQPRGLNDRAADNWRPLLAIAKVAGGEWSDLAATAAVSLSGSREDDDNLVRLLADIRDTFPRTPLLDPDEDCFSPTALAEALAKIEEIASVDGVDGVFIGPNDLSASFGQIGNWGHPEVQAAIEDAAKKIKKAGKAAGILTPNEEEAKKFISWGYTFVAVGADLGLLAKNADALAKRFKS